MVHRVEVFTADSDDDPGDTCDARRTPIPASCPLSSIFVLWCMHVCVRAHTHTDLRNYGEVSVKHI